MGVTTNTTIAKPIYKSKTFWINVIGFVIILIQVVPIPSEYQALVMAILNILNRFQTQDKVTLT